MILGKRVRLRPIEREDLPRFVEWFSNPEVHRYLGIYLPISLSKEKRWVERLQERLEKQEAVVLTTEALEDAHVGSISLFSINWKDRVAELWITIDEKSYWGQGYGSDAICTLLNLAFNRMNLHRVFLRVHEENARDIRCYEKVRFRHEGTLRESVFREGTNHDMRLMGILRLGFEADG